MYDLSLLALLLGTIPAPGDTLGPVSRSLSVEPCAEASIGVAREGDDYEQAALEAKGFWEEWTTGRMLEDDLEKKYSLVTVEDERIVICYPRGARTGRLKSASGKTVSAFDKLFPPEEREADAHARRSAVLFPIAGPKAFASVTGHIGQKVPRLAEWAKAAPRGVGFLLEEPLVAGWLVDVPSSEVWNPENELVNRLARMLVIERYGRLPYWLSQGFAWELELRVCRDVYCFPFRSGFVSKKEHRSWPSRLTAAMAARGETAITVEALSGWPRNTWNEDLAVLSWGAAAMLAKHYDEELPRVLSAYARLRSEEGRTTEPDGSWQLIPDYEIPAEKELEILNRELGVDFEAELTRFARRPKSYRRPR